MKTPIVIATRESPLALWQTRHVAALIEQRCGRPTRLLPMTTEGDRKLDVTLNKIGGKGLFLKELENALLDGRADLAVHSMKDVPAQMPESLGIAAMLPRHNPSDAWVSDAHASIDALPQGAVVGTSSLRRQAQLLLRRPDLIVRPLRGNVQTRLEKLDRGEYLAIVLATAGLQRMALDRRIAAQLTAPDWLPAVGQGAIGIEARCEDAEMHALLAPLNHAPTWHAVRAERRMNALLEGSCASAIGALAQVHSDGLHLQAAVYDPHGRRRVQAESRHSDPDVLGQRVAEALLQQGAAELLMQAAG